MRLFADEGVDRPIVEALRVAGHQVWYVAEMAPGLSDDEVLRMAHEAEALLLTADKDFGTLVYRLRRLTTGVILLRLAGLPPHQKAQRVAQVLQKYGPKMKASFTVITATTLRIRPLTPEV